MTTRSTRVAVLLERVGGGFGGLIAGARVCEPCRAVAGQSPNALRHVPARGIRAREVSEGAEGDRVATITRPSRLGPQFLEVS